MSTFTRWGRWRLTTVVSTGALPSSPFVAGPMLEDPQYFVGRKEELNFITWRMSGSQPISVNVVGKPRTGKSSLLYHFFLTWELRVQGHGKDTSQYIVAYLSLQEANCQSEMGFYQAVAQVLLSRLSGRWWQPALTNPLKAKSLNRQAFSDAIKQWKKQGVLPVLCLDGFEALLKYPKEFNDGFYDNLHSLMNHSALMLVVASRKPLAVYSRQHRLTSSFFNVGHVLTLGELTIDEANELVRLPASTVNGASAALSTDEQHHAQNWGGRHPYLLQLAGSCLWQARQQGRDVSWAKARFDQEARRVPRARFNQRKWWLPLRWVFWDIPASLGRIARGIGGTVDDIGNLIVGLVILLVLILILVGALNWDQVKELLQKALGG